MSQTNWTPANDMGRCSAIFTSEAARGWEVNAGPGTLTVLAPSLRRQWRRSWEVEVTPQEIAVFGSDGYEPINVYIPFEVMRAIVEWQAANQ